jgi:NADPH:quinone reductase-like Zn-dependent oxidoreductase
MNMRAAMLHGNGHLDSVRMGEIDAPTMGKDEILVRVRAAAINPADLKVVSGTDGGAFLHAQNFPTAFGFDFSGIVESVGRDVQGRSVGDEVFGFLAYSRSTRQGSFADLVVVTPDTVGDKPPNISHEEAAAAATAGSTALQALEDKGRLRSGHKVLVNGASGGVGSYAVQIASQLGAEVWGTASTAKADFVKSLGAARVIDYKTTPLANIDGKFDVVLDAASRSSFGEVSSILQPGGAPELFSISDLASEFDITHRTIRFYESKGLLTPHRLNGARIYSRRDRARLHIIVRAKGLGYTLDEAKGYLDLYGQPGERRIKQLEFSVAKSEQVIAELEAKRRQIDEKIEEVRLINQICKRKIAAKKRSKNGTRAV